MSGLTRFVMVASLALVACQKSNNPPEPVAPYDYAALVRADIQAFDDVDRVFASDKLSETGVNLFTSVFSGTSTAAVHTFLDQRIHYYLTESELDSYQWEPNSFATTRWTQKAAVSATGKVVLLAANVSAEAWLDGLVNRVPVTLITPTGRVPIDRPNAGVMLIGPGYQPTLNVGGMDYAIPAAYRQSILLHEARHSDCTGGLSETDVDVLREAQSYRDTDQKFKKQCGHLHTYCPVGHELAGELACDDLPWGAYSVGLVYGAVLWPFLTGDDKAVVEAQVADNYSRLLFDAKAMLKGKLGAPDMTSQGLRP